MALNPPGPEQGGGFGPYVAGLRDLDGDNTGEVLVGVPREHVAGLPWECGAAYVFSGANGQFFFRLLSPTPRQSGQFGLAVSGADDLNADGIPDMLVGAYFEGRLHVFSGRDGALIRSLTTPNPGQSVYFGYSAASVPDCTGDGIDDVLVGSPGDNSESGRAFLYNGMTGAVVATLSSPEPDPGGLFGSEIAGVPDVDGDGMGDILIGAPIEGDLVGRAYLFSGATGQLIAPILPPNDPPVTFGRRVLGLEDLDGDARGDIAVVGQGIHLYSGATGTYLRTLSAPMPPTVNFGFSLAALRDVSGDGLADILVGHPVATPQGQPTYAGAAFLFSGSDGRLLRRFVSPSPQINGALGVASGAVCTGSGRRRPHIVIGATGDCGGTCPPMQVGRVYIFRSCPTDWNYDGVNDSRDFFEFVRAFFEDSAAADWNADGVLESGDFFEFLEQFFDACP